jgi:HAMP domain-containing protein
VRAAGERAPAPPGWSAAQNDTFSDSVVDVDSVVDLEGDPLGFLVERDGPLTALARSDNTALVSAFLAGSDDPLAECTDEELGWASGTKARLAERRRDAASIAASAQPAEFVGAPAMWLRVERRLRPLLRTHAPDEAVTHSEDLILDYLALQAGGTQTGG